MKRLLYFALIIAVGYALVRYVPPDAKKQALAKAGLDNFFQNTLPNFLRAKLSIPESPAAKRRKLMNELASAIGGIENEISSIAPAGSGGKASSKLPKEIGQGLSEAQKLVEQSQDALAELEKADQGQGVFQKAAERILNKILPPAPADADSKQICGPQNK